MSRIAIDERWLRGAAWIVVCVAIVGGGVAMMAALVKFGPEAPKSEPAPNLPLVRVEEVQVEEVTIEIGTRGEVRPVRRTTLAAEVGGKLVTVHESFEAGAVFSEGDALLQIDSADHMAALASAAANLADARLALELEKSRRDQALRDWEKLGSGVEPSDLVKRIPQLASAEAAVAAAQRAAEKAQRDVDRTSITAPYACRIERTHVDLGAVVSPGMQLAEVVSTGAVEVRFPLPLADYGYLQRDETGEVTGEVTATGRIGGKAHTWTGQLVRSEEIVERSTRSINVVATFGGEGVEAPPIGMFVEAEISGISLPEVVRVPRIAMLNRNEVLLVTAENTLELRTVEVLRSEADSVLVNGGLKSGERIVTTQMSVPVPGTPVKVDVPAGRKGEDEKKEKPKQPDEVVSAAERSRR